MQSHFSVQRFEQAAQIACFCQNYQKKNEAERYFLELSKIITPQILTQIISNGSDTLIFVTIEYVNKMIDEYSLEFLMELFNAVETQISLWYLSEAHQFRRQSVGFIQNNVQVIQNKQVTKYVLNSISLFMSNCMKRFFLQDLPQKRLEIVQWISTRPNQRYKLWLFTIFIQNVSQIDTSMGFIKFRTLSYNFQEQVIPIISKCIIPFLYKVEDIMKINEISQLQEHLHVQEENSLGRLIQKKQKIFQNQNQFKFAQLVFQLLHNLVFYNFHLTYTEYEQQATFQNCLICFPQEFTAKVVNQQFIGSIGYVIERLIDLMPKSKFLKTTLQCLQKIFLTKLSYVDEAKKLNFIRECILMLTKCLKKNNIDQFTVTKLIVCNNKFLNNIDISYLKQKSQLKQPFHQWLLTITKTTLLVMENVELSKQFNFNIEESLVIQCLSLYQKIVSSLCAISYSAFQEINFSDNQEKKYLIQNVEHITSILLRKILLDRSKPLIDESTAQVFKSNVLEIKSFCSSFFAPFKQLASINYQFLFTQIEKCMDITLATPQISVKFNLFMLLCEVMDRNFLQRNIITVKATDEEVFILSKCVNKALKFLEIYLSQKNQIILSEQMVLMDISILIFFDKVLSQFLGYFENHESSIEIKQKIFLDILKIQNKIGSNSNSSEEFILFSIESVLQFLLIYNKSHQSNYINDFIFETINRILMKFKWGLKREVFKSSNIYFKLQQFFTQVEKETAIVNPILGTGVDSNLTLFHQFQRLKWRKKLLKVIALLYFDDIIDDYRRNLQNIFSSLKNEHILTILLDLEGIGQAIDTTSIYKSFIEMVQRYFSIDVLTNQLVKFANTFTGFDQASQKYPKIKIIKETIKMHKAILSNKGQRIVSPKNIQSVYFMVRDLIKYWIDFLRISDSQEWLPVIREIINLVSQLVKCDKINFYLVQRVCGHNYVDLFFQIFTKMEQMSQKIEQNPKFYEAYLSFLVNISRDLMEVIFFPSLKLKVPELSQKNLKITQTFLQIFLSTFKRIPGFLQEFKIGNTKNQIYLQKSIDVVKFTLVFIDLKKRQMIGHKEQMVNINIFVEEMKQLIYTYCNQLLSYLATQKHFSVHRRTLIILLYEASIIYPSLLEVLIQQMKLPNYLLIQAKQCLDYIHKEEQQLFIDRFKTWLKMMHMTEQEINIKKQQQRDFYGFMGII